MIRVLWVLIPYLPLRFRSKIYDNEHEKSSTNSEKYFDKLELTSFYNNIILILGEALSQNQLSEWEYKYIIDLLNRSLFRVFYKEPELIKEVTRLSDSLLKYWFEEEAELKEQIEAQKKELKDISNQLADKKKQLADKDNQLADKDNQLADKDNQLADKDNQLADMDTFIQKLQAEINRLKSLTTSK